MRRIALFTSNQPRHLALASTLSTLAEEIFVVQECTTAFPGQVEDFYRKSDVMQRYFERVIASEQKVFGGLSFLPANARSLSLRMGDLSSVGIDVLAPALNADLIVVFGSSWIRGPLADALIERKAINLHMGLSPWYRGTACNFWAVYDRRPEFVGGTIHLLSKGLDSGDVLVKATPHLVEATAFDLGMMAVAATHNALARFIAEGCALKPKTQDSSLEIRYSRNRDFTDSIAAEYLTNLPSAADILERRRQIGPVL